jgi:glyoxylate reductase
MYISGQMKTPSDSDSTMSPLMTRVLITRDLPAVARVLLQEEGFVVSAWGEKRPMNYDELMEAAGSQEAILCTITDRMDGLLLRACPRLRIVSQFGAGYDNIDIREATRLGIPIGNTPGAMSEATADIAFGLMIAASRKMFFMHQRIRDGKWGYFEPNENLGIELRNKTLGIFGLGRIGVEMGLRSKGAFEMKILYCNRTPNPEAERRLGARRVEFHELLAASDVLSVHAVLSDETLGIFDAGAFRRMKKSAIFINTARGAIHDEAALIRSLQEGGIWGAGLDVSMPEPMSPANPLLSMENVCVVPHIGSATIEARTRMARMAAENILEFYRGRGIPHLLNPRYIDRE